MISPKRGEKLTKKKAKGCPPALPRKKEALKGVRCCRKKSLQKENQVQGVGAAKVRLGLDIFQTRAKTKKSQKYDDLLRKISRWEGNALKKGVKREISAG